MGFNPEVLKPIRHLVRYAAFASGDVDGTEFRMLAPELRGPTNARKIEAKGPSYFTQNIRVHLGIRDERTVVVVFGGYDAPWLYEDYLVRPSSTIRLFSYIATDLRFSLRQISWNGGPKDAWVHKHYLLAFNELRDNLLRHIDDLLELELKLERTGGRQQTNIEICGHGLGGALATLCALWCATWWNDITCVTLGSPKVGNDKFAYEFQERNIKCCRLVMESDPFAAMPYVHSYHGAPAWQHVGEEICLSRPEVYDKSVGSLYKVFDSVQRSIESLISETADNVGEPAVVYLGLYFGLWIGYWLLKGAQLFLCFST